MTRDDSTTTVANRRKFLKTGSALAAAGLLAGCSGGGSGGDGGGGGSGGDGGSGDGGSDGGGGDSEMEEGGGDGGGGGTTTASGPPLQVDTITWTVPYGPGGGYDFYTRTLAQVLNSMNENGEFPASNEVTNVEGAGGVTATNQVANADPDGSELMIINTESFALNQIARPDATQYNLSEMTILPRVAGTTRAFIVSDDTDITDGDTFLQELAAGNLKIGNQGPNTTSAIMLKALAVLGGTDLTLETVENNMVTFNGRGSEFTALKRGDIQVMAGSFSSLRDFTTDARFVLTYTNGDSCPQGAENSGCDTFATLDTTIEKTDQIQAVSGGPFHRVFAGPPGMDSELRSYLCDKITQAIQSDQFAQLAEEADRPILYGDCETARDGVVTTLETYQSQKDLLRELGLI